MYTGILSDYDLSPQACELKTIYLIKGMRFSHTSKAFKELPGEFLVIPFENVYNINLRYLYEARRTARSANWMRYRAAFKVAFIVADILALIIFPVSRYRIAGLTRVLFAIPAGFGIFLCTVALIMTFSPTMKEKLEGQIGGIVVVLGALVFILTIVFLWL